MVELIVVVAIMAMMMGGGIATYSAFRSGKVSLRQAQVVADLLQEAKRSAVSGEKPTECEDFALTGYSVDISSTNATLVAICPGGSPVTKIKTLVDTSVSSTVNPITFRVLGGASVDATIDVCSDNHLFRITVTTAGNVTEPAEVAGGC
jgi:type II secretory pathway pseudopilin PulG